MRRTYRRRSSGYLLPFFLLVGFGVIVVLGFQLWSNLQVKRGDVYFYMVSGNAKVLPYGFKDWEDGYNGSKLRVGESIKTLGNSRLVLQFYNGTKIRLHEDTQLTLVDVSKNRNDEKILLALDRGSVWVNHVPSDDVANSQVEISTANLLIRDVGTIFTVEKRESESVRVMKGSVKVHVLAEEQKKDRLLQPSLDVGIGQQISLDAGLFEDFRNYENPSVLLPLDDAFKATEWYSWNIKEDIQPTLFQEVANPAPVSSPDLTSESLPPENQTEQTLPETPNPTSFVEVTQPQEKTITIKQGTYTIQGKVSADIHKIVVRQNFGGQSEQYVLKKFAAGNETFSYNLAEQYANLKAGDNYYEFTGYDADDKKIAISREITIHYDKPQISEPLETPKVISFNGSTSSEVNVGVVKVVGQIQGAAKVVVNGYTLNQFKPGSKEWIYYANENGGNLKVGLNEYEVYGIDADGKESERVKFTINYTKAEAAPAVVDFASPQATPVETTSPEPGSAPNTTAPTP